MSFRVLTAMHSAPEILVATIAPRRSVIPANFRVLQLPTAHQRWTRAERVLAPQTGVGKSTRAPRELGRSPRRSSHPQKGARNHLAQQVPGTFSSAPNHRCFRSLLRRCTPLTPVICCAGREKRWPVTVHDGRPHHLTPSEREMVTWPTSLTARHPGSQVNPFGISRPGAWTAPRVTIRHPVGSAQNRSADGTTSAMRPAPPKRKPQLIGGRRCSTRRTC